MSEEQKKTPSFSFLSIFIDDLQQLNHNFALFVNTHGLVQSAVGDEPTDEQIRGLTDDVKQEYVKINNVLRYYVTKTYISFESLRRNIESINGQFLSVDDANIIKETYELNKKKQVININSVESYILVLNAVLVSRLMQGIITSDEEVRRRMLQNG